jgi:PAS domain-containing protein
MSKISIGLRGWRFDEEEVFTEDGELRPLDELSEDARQRLVRLQDIADSVCDGCWLIHGDENIRDCNPAEAVYGEPLGEVIVCGDHEDDLIYWFREAGGDAYAGSDEFRDAFHEWFLDGGRAPEGYEGVQHVETDPEDLPDPSPVGDEKRREQWEVTERIDVRDSGDDAADDEPPEGDEDGDGFDDLDLSREYPGSDD